MASIALPKNRKQLVPSKGNKLHQSAHLSLINVLDFIYLISNKIKSKAV